MCDVQLAATTNSTVFMTDRARQGVLTFNEHVCEGLSLLYVGVTRCDNCCMCKGVNCALCSSRRFFLRVGLSTCLSLDCSYAHVRPVTL